MGLFSGFKPEGFAKNIAKAQAKVYKRLLLAGKLDGNTNEDDWRQVLLTRPGYSKEDVEDILETTKQTCDEHNAEYNFQAVVIHLAAFEYQKLTGEPADLRKLALGVCSVISSNMGGK